MVVDGRIVAAAQEERFSRRKHDAGFPRQALRYCLAEAGIRLDELDCVAFYDKPLLKFERLLETYLAFAPRGFASFSMAIPVWLREKLFLRERLIRELDLLGTGKRSIADRIVFSEHHLSHAASAFFPSPYDEAAVLTMDGVGEWATTSVASGSGKRLEIRREIHFPHSLGLLYAAFTGYIGFKVNSGEYKLMGLAPFGEPKYAGRILEHLLDLKPDGSFRLNLAYFDYCTGLTMTGARFHDLFGGAPRASGAPLTQRDMDLAASIQAVTEEVVLRLTRSLARETGSANLCLAGGVALNCVANGKVLRDRAFKNVWIQPAAGDAGGALGAALVACHLHKGQARVPRGTDDDMQGALLGPAFSEDDTARRLTAAGAKFEVLPQAELIRRAAEALAGQQALGWFQGRMEFGPRALGARSILGDPRSPRMQSVMNQRIKYRESFRPFAPAVLRERAGEYFEIDRDSPYMLFTADVVRSRRTPVAGVTGIERVTIPHSDIPAVTHVDHSARIQTVDARTHPCFHALISAFAALTGCPVVLNTSFNVRGEPVVGTPEDAFRCFMGSGIERLAVGNCWLRKEDQDPGLQRRYEADLEPD